MIYDYIKTYKEKEKLSEAERLWLEKINLMYLTLRQQIRISESNKNK